MLLQPHVIAHIIDEETNSWGVNNFNLPEVTQIASGKIT